MAQKEGFEPSRAFYTPTPLAGEPLRPLGYFCNSECLRIIAQREQPCQVKASKSTAILSECIIGYSPFFRIAEVFQLPDLGYRQFQRPAVPGQDDVFHPPHAPAGLRPDNSRPGLSIRSLIRQHRAGCKSAGLSSLSSNHSVKEDARAGWT